MKFGKNVRVCVIGAGPSGITAAKHLLQVGITNLVVYDRNDQVGGNWIYSDKVEHSSVYETAHIISSKRLSQYHDYPMPDHYPDYPNHVLLKEYFQSYARHFGVTDYIQFNTEVKDVTHLEADRWQVTLGDGRQEIFDYVLIANGHHWNPRYPRYEGEFTGEILHSHYYRSHLPFKGKRVLVVGGGNSAADIATDVARHAAFVGISWRRGYYIIPKIIFGQPPDVINARLAWLPRALRVKMNYLTWKLVTGGNEQYGLQAPEVDILDQHPVINSDLLTRIRHGDIQPRRDIQRYEGKTVVFVDGKREDYDVIIPATGYIISFPFFDKSLIDFSEGDVPLYLRVFHPDFRSLFFIGLVQPQGCIWPLADTQAQLVANYITGNYALPPDMRARVQAEVDEIKRRYVKSARHTVEVEYHEYQNALFKEVPRFAPRWRGAPKTQPV
jgi:cation diffusion facilitator CzcD-associated flavoprotein CzcO